MAFVGPNEKKIKSLRDNWRKWELESDRREFLHQLYPLIGNWYGRAPDILNIFKREEIECLLVDSVKYLATDCHGERYLRNNHVSIIAVESFIDFVIWCGYKDEPNVNDVHRTTLLHHLTRSSPHKTYSSPIYLKHFCLKLFKMYDTFAVNYIDDETGYTHFHVACRFGCEEIVEKFLQLGQDPNMVQRKTGDRPLHMAVKYHQKRVMEVLLKAGADPNRVDEDGKTALHVIAKACRGGDNFAKTLFELSRVTPLVNARDNSGDTPLRYALLYYRRQVLELLLEKGADPNLANNRRETPLHDMSRNYYGSHLGEILFSICDSKSRTVLIDVEDERGNTPLLLALLYHNEKIVDLLMRRGADPDLTVGGSTALHVICKTDEHDVSAKILFKICDELNRTVRVEARDKAGKTPLQLAVTTMLPNTVELLLKHGADVTNCVFPTVIKPPAALKPYASLGLKMRVACGALAVAEHLQSNGYDFSRSDALTIMKFFGEHKLFNKSSTKVGECWYDDDEVFASEAKKIMITSSASLYDVLKLRPEEEDKLLAYTDYYEFAQYDIPSRPNAPHYRVWERHGPHYRTCIWHLCEKMSRGFFRRWSLDAFWELIRKRLPTVCCEKIFVDLTNEDLYHICLAAAGERSS